MSNPMEEFKVEFELICAEFTLEIGRALTEAEAAILTKMALLALKAGHDAGYTEGLCK